MRATEGVDDVLVPNLVIAGAPRSGTTSVYSYLRAHPEVCGSEPKETLFLMDEGYPLSRPENDIHSSGVDAYETFFPDYDGDRHTVVMEATPDYLYQQTAREFFARRSGTKIVFILRRPQDRVRSVYSFAVNRTGVLPKDLSFERYVEQMLDGALDIDNEIISDSIGQSKYIEHIEKWFELVDPDRVLLLRFEDLERDPSTTMKTLASFCGIDATFYDRYPFTVINSSNVLKFGRADSALRRIVRPFRRHGWYGRLKDAVRPVYSRLQGEDRSQTARSGSNEVGAQLRESFASSNQRLNERTGLDIGDW